MKNRGGKGRRPAVWRVFEPGCIDYAEALELQHRLVAARKSRALDTDLLMVLEHPPVFTLGRRGGRENLIVSSDFLARSGVEVIQTERGGNITYHGPGQLVAYLILDLEAARLGVKDLVYLLEEAMLRTAAGWSIAATRSPVNHGIWVGGSKMGSIGIAIRRGITYHGLALNVDPALEPFSWINPCGLAGVGVTSLKQASGLAPDMRSVQPVFKTHIQTVFGTELVAMEPAEVSRLTMSEKQEDLK
ncbi:MAG: lipoyl(octanoyl) transferase LipB [Desulfobacterales bacterium]